MPSDEVVPGMAEAIERRRRELGLSPGDFATAAGLTRQGLDPVRKGYRRAYQDKVRLGVARALAWPLDAIDRLLAGEDPATFAHTTHATGNVTIGVGIAGSSTPSGSLSAEVIRGNPDEIQLAASGVDLEELRLADPDAYALVMDLAKTALDRARARRGS